MTKEQMIIAIEQAKSCIEDLGSGKGGWAWEDMIEELQAVKEEIEKDK